MQDLASRLAADARVRALHSPALWVVVLLGVTVTILFTYAIVQTAFVLTAQPGVQALEIDFRVFWAAGRLALIGEPLAAFDMARLAEIHQINPDAYMPWLYPPGYLMLLMPFGALPFAPALLAMTLVSVALMALAVRPFTAGSLPLWVALTLAPAYLPTLILGQNSLWWLAGLLAAFAALRGGHWVLAGICIGCLTLKPQLGLLIPVALVAAGLWRTVLAATVTAAILAALPTLVFGPGYWPSLATALGGVGGMMMQTIQNLPLMVGPFSLMVLAGLAPPLALAAQWAIALLAAGLVFLLWRSDRIGFDAKAAGLMLGILLSASYLWYYEAAIMAAIGLFLLRAGVIGRSFPGLLLLAGLWLGGGLQAANALLKVIDARMIGAVLITPLLLAALAALVLHCRAPRPGTPA